MSQKIVRSQPRLRLEKTAPALRSHYLTQVEKNIARKYATVARDIMLSDFGKKLGLKANGPNVMENSEVPTQTLP